MTARWSGRQSRRCIPRRLLALPCSNWESYLASTASSSLRLACLRLPGTGRGVLPGSRRRDLRSLAAGFIDYGRGLLLREPE